MKESTHINGNRLDLVLSNLGDAVSEVRMDGRLGHSDHEMICADLQEGVVRSQDNWRYRDYNRANYRDARIMMGRVDWCDRMSERDVKEMWEVLGES